VVTTYVVPQVTGAIAVSPTSAHGVRGRPSAAGAAAGAGVVVTMAFSLGGVYLDVKILRIEYLSTVGHAIMGT
jgi:hypothetical protein